MADAAAKAAYMGRILAILHIIVGFLLFCFGIADYVVGYFWTGYGCFGIWIGVWMCIAGGLGIPGTRKDRTSSRNVFASVFMGFSITSAVFGGIIIICYSLAIAIYRDYYYYDYYSGGRYRKRNYDKQMALTVIILILGIVEFAIGIWVSVCICLMNPCQTCCYNTSQQQGQVTYTANPGYVMTQGPGGVPMAVPMQAGGGMAAIQTTTTGTQEGQPQMVLLPVSGAMGYQHQYAPQAAAHGASGYQPQQVQMPSVHWQGQRVTGENEQVPVKI